MKMGNRREGKSSWIIPYFLKKKETCWPSPRQGKLAVKAEKNPEGEFLGILFFVALLKDAVPAPSDSVLDYCSTISKLRTGQGEIVKTTG